VEAVGSSAGRGISYVVPVQKVGSSGASEVVVELVDGTKTTVGRNETSLSMVAGEKIYVGVETRPAIYDDIEVAPLLSRFIRKNIRPDLLRRLDDHPGG
jgi:hypothetical protein